MGMYVYKVLAKRVKCSDGGEANVSKFAYKPSMSGWGGDSNRRWHFQSGCSRADKMAEDGKFTGRIVPEGAEPGSKVYRCDAGHFYDDSTFTAENRVEGVVVV